MTPEEMEQLVLDISFAINKSTIQKEAQSIELRKAVIEKTLSGLAWSAVVGFGYVVLNWATSHGYKP